MHPRVLILHANGTNRDNDLAQAFTQAGAKPDIIHLHTLKASRKSWRDYQLLALPGGFSYADTLGAGRMFALDLQLYFADELQHFVDSNKPVIGICNGFQALVKAGVLPEMQMKQTDATLTFNQSGKFICRWVTLKPQSKICVWTRDLQENFDCPIAHGEGRFMLRDEGQLKQLQQTDQIALTYQENPNGSMGDIAGLCNPSGNVLGLMPHPENHIYFYQHPLWTRGVKSNLGLQLFINGIKSV